MRSVAHVVSFRGVANVHRIKQDFIFSLTPDWYANHAQRYRFFYSASFEDWTRVEDSSQWGFKAYNSLFCIRGAAMGFPQNSP